MKRQKKPYHGKALIDYILITVSQRQRIMFHELYPEILDSYGSVSSRTLHRKLQRLCLQGKLTREIESRSEVYYRLSKTVSKIWPAPLYWPNSINKTKTLPDE